MAFKKFELTKLYKIKFADHSIGSQERMICEAVGWVIKDCPEHVVLTAWNTITKDETIRRDNYEPISILKAVIISTRKYS